MVAENDWLEAIIALPTDMFYNTGIATYVWIISNKKQAERRGKVQLINAVEMHTPMRKSLGSKRKQISDEQIKTITQWFDEFDDSEQVKLFNNEDFGYSRVTVERPLKLNFAVTNDRLEKLELNTGFSKLKEQQQKTILDALESLDSQQLWLNREAFIKSLKKTFKQFDVDVKGALLKTIWQALSDRDEEADVCTDAKGNPEPDTELRDYENIPLTEDIETYFQREVIPHVPDAWIDHSKTKVGYEIPFNRHFYKYVPPRSLEDIDADLDKVSAEIMQLLQEVHV